MPERGKRGAGHDPDPRRGDPGGRAAGPRSTSSPTGSSPDRSFPGCRERCGFRHVGWDLSSAGLRMLLDALHVVGPGARSTSSSPGASRGTRRFQREVSAAARSGAVTSGPPGALPGSWADVEVLPGLGRDARAPATLADALEAYARGRPVLAADSEVARADLPAAAPSSFPARTARRSGRRSRRSAPARTSSRSRGQRRARTWNDDMMGRGCEVCSEISTAHTVLRPRPGPGVGCVETVAAGRLEWVSPNAGRPGTGGHRPRHALRRVRVSSIPLDGAPSPHRREPERVRPEHGIRAPVGRFPDRDRRERRRRATRARAASPGSGRASRRAAGPVRVRAVRADQEGALRAEPTGAAPLLGRGAGGARAALAGAERRRRLPHHPVRDGRAGRDHPRHPSSVWRAATTWTARWTRR
jgi:hypothetical protein